MKSKYNRILNIIALGISIFSVEFIIQVLFIFLLNYNFTSDLLNGIINNPFNYNNTVVFWGTKNVFYLRLLFYLPIWIIAFIPGCSILDIKNSIFRIISYNFFMILMTFVITAPVSIFFLFSPFIYYLVVSIILSPIIIYSIPYFRNFLNNFDDYVKGI